MGGECVVSLVVFGDDDHTARFAVEAVDDAGAGGAAAGAECAEVVGECAGECAFPMAFSGVNDHAGPLVDDDDRIVFVKNTERDLLRLGSFAGSCDLVDDNDATFVESQRCFTGGVVDVDVTGVDCPAQGRAAEGGKLLGEKYVEPAACLFRRDRETLGPRWEVDGQGRARLLGRLFRFRHISRLLGRLFGWFGFGFFGGCGRRFLGWRRSAVRRLFAVIVSIGRVGLL